jgi:DNA adenine methylase
MSVKRIVARMPEHRCYCEVFAGAGWVLFGKPPSRVEVLNDLNGELMNFYRETKLHPRRVVRLIESMPHSRKLFEELRDRKPAMSRKAQRAARFAYLLKTAFAGDLSKKPTFGYSKMTPHRVGIHVGERILDAAKRLQSVTLEYGDWRKIISRYDGPQTLFYCDPPYVDLRYYEHNFEQPDHEALALALRRIEGKFMLSYNDVPEVRRLYAWARMEVLGVTYRIKDIRVRTGQELLITNFEPVIRPEEQRIAA